jgi:hypothetical protein
MNLINRSPISGSALQIFIVGLYYHSSRKASVRPLKHCTDEGADIQCIIKLLNVAYFFVILAVKACSLLIPGNEMLCIIPDALPRGRALLVAMARWLSLPILVLIKPFAIVSINLSHLTVIPDL